MMQIPGRLNYSIFILLTTSWPIFTSSHLLDPFLHRNRRSKGKNCILSCFLHILRTCQCHIFLEDKSRSKERRVKVQKESRFLKKSLSSDLCSPRFSFLLVELFYIVLYTRAGDEKKKWKIPTHKNCGQTLFLRDIWAASNILRNKKNSPRHTNFDFFLIPCEINAVLISFLYSFFCARRYPASRP